MKSVQNTILSKNGRFELDNLLAGHQGPVAAIAAHPLGTYVASGGKVGTLIWNLRDAELLASPAGSGDQGATLALAWVTGCNDTEEGLVFGTAQGYLCLWRRPKGWNQFIEADCRHLNGGTNGQEIASLSYDAKSSQLTVAHQAEIIHVFTLDIFMQPTKVFSVKVADHYPQTVIFGQPAAFGPKLLSFGRDDGEVLILDNEGKVIKNKTTGVVIGHAAVNLRNDVFVIADMFQGPAIYKYTTQERIRVFQLKARKQLRGKEQVVEWRSKNVAFLGDGKMVVSGSDHGKLYIFERRTEELYDVIDVGGGDWVQTLTVTELDGVQMVIAGMSRDNVKETLLQVWRRVFSGGMSAERSNVLNVSVVKVVREGVEGLTENPNLEWLKGFVEEHMGQLVGDRDLELIGLGGDKELIGLGGEQRPKSRVYEQRPIVL
ncbi:hypothetical protein L218DRAFT_1008667 [Marasmius fiardii PR-910]|nr:hypothetical protein L218DRAFT_1008667 [Marasmius fiardii PR-910]